MCFASSGPGGIDHSLEDVIAALDRLIEVEGRAEVCQLSGGEPTLHPQFETIVDEALARPIDYVMVNTNGIRLSKDDRMVEFLSQRKNRVEIYLQWDGIDAATNCPPSRRECYRSEIHCARETASRRHQCDAGFHHDCPGG